MEVFNEMGKYFLNYIKKKINKQNHGVYTGGKARRNYMQVLSPVAKLCVVLHVHFLMFFSKVIYQLQWLEQITTKIKKGNIKAPGCMVWKAVNRPTDIPVACGEAESLSLQGLTPSQVGKEGRVYFQTWQDSGSSDPSNLNSRNHVRRWVVRDWIVIPKEDMVVLEKTPESPLRVPGGQTSQS